MKEKKVRITGCYEEYIGQIGIVTHESLNVFEVKMDNGKKLVPYKPGHGRAQCELVEESEQLPIFN